MTRLELETRTKTFHVNVIKLCTGLPKNAAGFETGKQLIRAAGSVGAIIEQQKGLNQTMILFIKLKLF